MLIDYLTVAAVLMMVFSVLVVSTGGWEALRTQKGLETLLLVPLLWPVIISCIALITITISIVITFALVYGVMKADKTTVIEEGYRNV